MPTVLEFQASNIENCAKNVAYWIETTKPEKLDWKPEVQGENATPRTIYSQVNECAQINRIFADTIAGREKPEWRMEHTYKSPADAANDLRESAAYLANTLRSSDESVIGTIYETSIGNMPGSVLMTIALANMYYHGGQINYIQTLYGDTEFRFPEN